MIEAEAGLMHITGERTATPVKVGVAITDLTTGLYAQSAILAALYGRKATGQGVHIDANLFDSQIASLANIGSNWLVAGKEAERQGTAHPSIVPYQTV
jgi:succinate--hydroxymethylglutarate CoA-transferase